MGAGLCGLLFLSDWFYAAEPRLVVRESRPPPDSASHSFGVFSLAFAVAVGGGLSSLSCSNMGNIVFPPPSFPGALAAYPPPRADFPLPFLFLRLLSSRWRSAGLTSSRPFFPGALADFPCLALLSLPPCPPLPSPAPCWRFLVADAWGTLGS